MAVRRCNQCREYFPKEDALKVGGVFVCSDECRAAKLRKVFFEGQSAQSKSNTKNKPKVDKAKVRQEVIDRDGNCCLMCGTTFDLHLHRVIYGSQQGKYEVGNCVLLCGDHHNMGRVCAHSNKKVFQPILLAHLDGDEGARSELRRAFRDEVDAL